MMRAGPGPQRGVALLVALLAVALAAVLIASLLDRGELAYARTRNALRNEQAAAYVQGLEAYAGQVLAKDTVEDPDIDANTDVWAQPMPPQEVPGGFIAGSARDLNGCFNLNNLSPAAQDRTQGSRALFRNLLNVLRLDPGIADAASRWIGGESGSTDSIDAPYLALPVPYRSAQRRFVHVSELRLVLGVGSDAYARLAPYVCALPPGTPLNVNTASVPVLQSLGLSQAQAEALWQNGTARFSEDEFRNRLQQLGIPPLDPPIRKLIGTTSQYFLVRADITLDGVPFTFFSLMERGRGIRVIGRSRGADDVLASAVDFAGEPDAR